MRFFIFMLHFVIIVSCTDTIFDDVEQNQSSLPTETRAVGDPFHSGLSYTLSPALNVWTPPSTNLTGTCGNSTGGLIKAKIYQVDGDIAWVEVVKSDGTKFTSSGNIYVKFEGICGTLATLRSQSQTYSSSFAANVSSIKVPFLIIPGVSKVYVQIVSSGRYHAAPITLNAGGWMTSSHASIERSIVNTARNQVGQSSGISTINSCYLTDMSNGDFLRWKNAMNVLHTFKLANPNAQPTSTVKTNMRSFLTPSYIVNDANLIIDQMILKYNGSVPSTENDMMSLNGVRQQCKEKQVKFALASGGVCKEYTSNTVSDWKNWRPGMALFYRFNNATPWSQGARHAMTISEIKWVNNLPTFDVKVIEANWGSGFSNPNGSIPWQRTVTQRSITINTSNYKVVDQKS